MRAEPFPVKRDPGVGQGAADPLHEFLRLFAVADPRPVEIAESADSLQRDGKRSEFHAGECFLHSRGVAVLADKSKREVEILRPRVMPAQPAL